ncbi:uncharacterized protein [Solanum tuberosum]|uniref:uncharacterized protein n=1 Tax=Solanum tuberosum TaxID=4113 RepID=UPI00073A1AB5|nr:PREDICTED: uncharacterized protein LOC107059343 [Solanum tuberosum]
MVQLDILDSRRVLAYMGVQSSLLDRICGCQYEDETLVALRDRVLAGDGGQATLDPAGVLKFAGRICVPRVGDLIQLILSKAHVKAEHLRPGGEFQRLSISEWEWDRITMDFVAGLPWTSRGVDSIWVIVDQLSKSTHFLPVQSSFSTEILARIYIR